VGLWDTWKTPVGQELRSCVFITTTPNALVAPIHNRMPAILIREDEATWLNRDEMESEALLPLLLLLPVEDLCTQVTPQQAHEVGTRREAYHAVLPFHALLVIEGRQVWLVEGQLPGEGYLVRLLRT
jgi:putative SOS response-associated peptidase YedK